MGAESRVEVEDESRASPAILVRTGETRLVEWVESLYQEAKDARREDANEEQWDTWTQQYWGRMWPDSMPTYKAPIVINEMKMLILAEVSDLTDSRLHLYVQKSRAAPQRDEQVEAALKAYWDRAAVGYQLMLATLDAMILPCGFIQSLWDPTSDHGRGQLLTTARDPRGTYIDPNAVDDETWRYVILEDVLDLVTVRELWPDQGPRVKADPRWSLGLGTKDTGTRHARYAGPLYAGHGTHDEGYSVARGPVLSVFVYDPKLEEDIQERTDPSTGEKTLVSLKKKAYPKGRLIQVCHHVVLSDGPSHYPTFPLIRVSVDPAPHRFWPPGSIVGGVVDGYIAANKLDSLVVENALRLNGGKLVADANSGIDPTRQANIPGEVLLKRPGSEVKIEYPPAMPADMVQAGGRLRQQLRENALGFMPSRMGTGSRGNVAAELTETEISQSMGLSRLRGRMLYLATQKLVRLLLGNMATFYTTPRTIPSIVGGQWQPVEWQPVADPEAYTVHV